MEHLGVVVVLLLAGVAAQDDILWESLDPSLPYEYFFSQNYTLHLTHDAEDLIYHMERDWYGAREWCLRNGGGDLVDIRSEMEADAIKAKLASYRTQYLFPFWSGMNDLDRDEVWTWQNGTKVDTWISTDVSDWLYFGIEEMLKTRLCANLHFQPEKRFRFHTNRKNGRKISRGTTEVLIRNCGTRYPFVCKRPNGTSTSTNITKSDWRDFIPTYFRNDQGHYCPEGSIVSGDKCIFIYEDSPKDWDKATQFCRTKHGTLADLVSFHSEEELLSVREKLKNLKFGYWTGLMKEWSPLRKPLFLWSDGSSVINFTWTDKWLEDDKPQRSWNDIEKEFRIPLEKDRDCAFITGPSSTAFQVTECDIRRSFICQIDRRDLGLTTTSRATTPTSSTLTKEQPTTLKTTTEETTTVKTTTQRPTTVETTTQEPTTVRTTMKETTTVKTTTEQPTTNKTITQQSTTVKTTTEQPTTNKTTTQQPTTVKTTTQEPTTVKTTQSTTEELSTAGRLEEVTTESGETVSLSVLGSSSAEPQFTTQPTSALTTVSTTEKTTSATTPTTTKSSTTVSSTFTTTTTTKRSTSTRTTKTTTETSTEAKRTTAARTTPGKPSPCAPGFVFRLKACYKVMQTPETFDNAVSTCKNQFSNASLLSVESADENTAARGLALEHNISDEMWLALKIPKAKDSDPFIFARDRTFFWQDGRPVFYAFFEFHEIPDPMSFHEDFVCVSQEPSKIWPSWLFGDCDRKLAFVCKYSLEPSPAQSEIDALKLDPNLSCPVLFVGFADDCYSSFSAEDDLVTGKGISSSFKSAVERCSEKAQLYHSRGRGLLAVPNTEFKLKFFHHVAARQLFPFATNDSFWVGIYRSRNGEVLSMDGSSVSNLPITAQDADSGDCVVLLIDQNTARLQWENCNAAHGYFCSIPKIALSAELMSIDLSATNTAPSVRCPAGGDWKLFENHCYLFFANQFISWIDAKHLCESQPTGDADRKVTLASIHSLSENTFISMYMRLHSKLPVTNGYWIGMFRSPRGEWIWIDGSPVDFSNWFVGMGSDDPVTCASVPDSAVTWVPEDCDTPMTGVVCKIVADTHADADVTTDAAAPLDVTTEAQGAEETSETAVNETEQFSGIGPKAHRNTPQENIPESDKDTSNPPLSTNVVVILLLLTLLLFLVFTIIFLLVKRQRLKRFAAQQRSVADRVFGRQDSQRRNILPSVTLSDMNE